MTRIEGKDEKKLAAWSEPKLVRLSIDLRAVAGNRFPPGDNGVSNGKASTPTS